MVATDRLKGAATLFCMPDSPSLSGRWLSTDEIRYLELQNLIREAGRAAHEMDRFRWKDLWEMVTDYKLYQNVCIIETSATCLYG